MFHVFSLVCFLIYGVNRRQVKWKGVKSEKIKVFLLVCSKYLSSWTGPDMTEVRVLVQFCTFRVQKLYFDEIYINDSASFLLEKLRNHVILTKNLNICPQIPKILPKSSKMHKDKGFPRARSGLGPIWALMGPYGSSWTGPDMTKSGLLVQFRTFRVQKWYFDEMT